MKKIEIKFLKDKKKRRILIVIGLCIVVLISWYLLQRKKNKDAKDRFYHIAFSDAQFCPGENVTVDVVTGNFPGSYPATSFQIDFDPTQLEFIQLKQGNIVVHDVTTQSRLLPEWTYQTELANRDGTIRTMYLDMTAENAPLNFETKEKNVLFRIEFKVRDSCSTGDIIRLMFSQATFATVDESNSLSMQKENVRWKDGEYIVP